MKRNEFRDVVDRQFSGLVWDEAKSRRVLDAIDGRDAPRRTAVPVRRKLSLALVMTMVAVLLATTALAVALIRYSPGVNAENLARQTLIEQYGLTRETLGLFRTTVEEKDGVSIVSFYDIPSGRADINPLTGVYTVTVRRGKATAVWSHDDADPAIWQSGDLSAPVWGQPQLEVYLLRTYEAWPYIMEAMEPDEEVHEDRSIQYYIHEEAFQSDSGWLEPIEPGEGDMPLERAQALAREAVMDSFALTEEDFALSSISDTYLWRTEDDRHVWTVRVWIQPGGVDMTFWVRLDSDSGEVLDLALETGGNG